MPRTLRNRGARQDRGRYGLREPIGEALQSRLLYLARHARLHPHRVMRGGWHVVYETRLDEARREAADLRSEVSCKRACGNRCKRAGVDERAERGRITLECRAALRVRDENAIAVLHQIEDDRVEPRDYRRE